MKKSLIILMILLFITPAAFAEIFHMDGHDWNKLTEYEKLMHVRGVMIGMSTAIEILDDFDAPDSLIAYFYFYNMTVGDIVAWLNVLYRPSSGNLNIPLRITLQVLQETALEEFYETIY